MSALAYTAVKKKKRKACYDITKGTFAYLTTEDKMIRTFVAQII